MASATRHDGSRREAYGEVATLPGVRGSHHVLGVEHLLSELGDGDSTVLLTPTGSQRREASHEEMKTRERYYNTHQLVNR